MVIISFCQCIGFGAQSRLGDDMTVTVNEEVVGIKEIEIKITRERNRRKEESENHGMAS